MKNNRIMTVYCNIPHDIFIDIVYSKNAINVANFILDKLNTFKNINTNCYNWLLEKSNEELIKNTAIYNLKVNKLLSKIFNGIYNIPNYRFIEISNDKLILRLDEQSLCRSLCVNNFNEQKQFQLYTSPDMNSKKIKLSKELDEFVFRKLGRMIFESSRYITILDRMIDGSINIIDRKNVEKYYNNFKDGFLNQDIYKYEFNLKYNKDNELTHSEDLLISTYNNTQSIYVLYNDEVELEKYLADGWIKDNNPDFPVVFKGDLIAVHNSFFLFYEDEFKDYEEKAKMMAFTIQTTDECNLCCTYCYQINKGHRKMTKETAKKVIDQLLSINEENTTYLHIEDLQGILIEFVGGDGLIDTEIIDYALCYFIETAINMNHKWADKWQAYISTNGVLYRSEKAQELFNKWNYNVLSLAITVDGNKELHDKCRIFPDGSGSYDLAMDANLDLLKKDYSPSSKITLSPDNLEYLEDSIKDFINKGFLHIWFNGIFEHDWTADESRLYYNQLKNIIDYIFDNNLQERINLVPLKEAHFKPKPEEDNMNYCGGNGQMLMTDPDGVFHNCTRYSSSSLGNDRPALIIGNCNDGIGVSLDQKNNIKMMQEITRRSQSTDECFYCPIAAGCPWCSAYNYQRFGTPNKRTVTTCNLHKAEALAAIYYWSKYYKSIKSDKIYEIYFDYNFVKDIISETEFNYLLSLKNKGE